MSYTPLSEKEERIAQAIVASTHFIAPLALACWSMFMKCASAMN